ncbi:MAG: response regulator [Lachnospiraceae bacterium]|nr:response regulator [Lachnospiraceae bacterium]
MRQSTLGSYIRSLRAQKGLTQAALADQLGVTDKAVSKWERNLSYPDIQVFPCLARILGVTVDDLLGACIHDGRPGRFMQIYDLTQDVRTPLHIILGCVDLAEADPGDRERLLHYLKLIRASGEYLLTVLQNAGVTPAGSGDYIQRKAASYGEAAGSSPERYDFSGRRILIVEDMEVNREIAAGILRPTGARTDFAEDGQACLDLIQAAPAGTYDLILMDLLMPRMNGVEATARIRSLPDRRKASIPIIAMTANVHEHDRNAALEAGMNAFTEKPVRPDNLFSVMQQYLS